jgi:hypothetical protein
MIFAWLAENFNSEVDSETEMEARQLEEVPPFCSVFVNVRPGNLRSLQQPIRMRSEDQ